jgi:hypothetical protein
VAYLAGLSDEDFDAFIGVVRETSPAVPTDDVLNAFTPKLPQAQGGSVTTLLEFALSTRRLTSTLQTSVQTVATAVAAAYSRTRQAKTDQTDMISARIEALLATDFISVRSKSQALEAEVDLRFSDCLCLTDLRPVFDPQGKSDDLSGFIIVHTLKLDVGGSRNTPLYITLDAANLDKLAGVLRRAQKKEGQMQEFLNTAKVPDLTVRERS